MKRLFISFIFLIILSNFVGCTKVADRIYTVCMIEDDKRYVYNSNGEFFTLKNNYYLKHSGVGLECKPALQLITTDKDSYSFVADIPGLYTGTLEDVSSYVKYLGTKGYTHGIKRADCKDIEVLCTSVHGSVRILFNISGTVRIYAVDKDGTTVEPPFISEKH